MGSQITYMPKRTNHVLHLILTVLTFGFWLPVWLFIAFVNSMREERITTHYASAPPLYAPGQYGQMGQLPFTDPHYDHEQAYRRHLEASSHPLRPQGTAQWTEPGQG